MLRENKHDDICYRAETVGYTTSHPKRFVLPDVQTEEVSPAEYVVSAKHHPYIGHEDILQESYTHLQSWLLFACKGQDQCQTTYLNTAHDGGGECGVALRAQHDGVHQNEAVQHNRSITERQGCRTLPISEWWLSFTPWHRRAWTAQQMSGRTTRRTPKPARRQTRGGSESWL